MIKIKCDYIHPEGTACDEGRVLIYGEMGGRLPQRIQCPKCKGEGVVYVETSVIQEKIDELNRYKNHLIKEIKNLDREIEFFENYLK